MTTFLLVQLDALPPGACKNHFGDYNLISLMEAVVIALLDCAPRTRYQNEMIMYGVCEPAATHGYFGCNIDSAFQAHVQKIIDPSTSPALTQFTQLPQSTGSYSLYDPGSEATEDTQSTEYDSDESI
jgi:hypothetical protein